MSSPFGELMTSDSMELFFVATDFYPHDLAIENLADEAVPWWALEMLFDHTDNPADWKQLACQRDTFATAAESRQASSFRESFMFKNAFINNALRGNPPYKPPKLMWDMLLVGAVSGPKSTTPVTLAVFDPKGRTFDNRSDFFALFGRLPVLPHPYSTVAYTLSTVVSGKKTPIYKLSTKPTVAFLRNFLHTTANLVPAERRLTTNQTNELFFDRGIRLVRKKRAIPLEEVFASVSLSDSTTRRDDTFVYFEVDLKSLCEKALHQVFTDESEDDKKWELLVKLVSNAWVRSPHGDIVMNILLVDDDLSSEEVFFRRVNEWIEHHKALEKSLGGPSVIRRDPCPFGHLLQLNVTRGRSGYSGYNTMQLVKIHLTSLHGPVKEAKKVFPKIMSRDPSTTEFSIPPITLEESLELKHLTTIAALHLASTTAFRASIRNLPTDAFMVARNHVNSLPSTTAVVNPHEQLPVFFAERGVMWGVDEDVPIDVSPLIDALRVRAYDCVESRLSYAQHKILVRDRAGFVEEVLRVLVKDIRLTILAFCSMAGAAIGEISIRVGQRDGKCNVFFEYDRDFRVSTPRFGYYGEISLSWRYCWIVADGTITPDVSVAVVQNSTMTVSRGWDDSFNNTMSKETFLEITSPASNDALVRAVLELWKPAKDEVIEIGINVNFTTKILWDTIRDPPKSLVSDPERVLWLASPFFTTEEDNVARRSLPGNLERLSRTSKVFKDFTTRDGSLISVLEQIAKMPKRDITHQDFLSNALEEALTDVKYGPSTVFVPSLGVYLDEIDPQIRDLLITVWRTGVFPTVHFEVTGDAALLAPAPLYFSGFFWLGQAERDFPLFSPVIHINRQGEVLFYPEKTTPPTVCHVSLLGLDTLLGITDPAQWQEIAKAHYSHFVDTADGERELDVLFERMDASLPTVRRRMVVPPGNLKAHRNTERDIEATLKRESVFFVKFDSSAVFAHPHLLYGDLSRYCFVLSKGTPSSPKKIFGPLRLTDAVKIAQLAETSGNTAFTYYTVIES